MVERLKAALQRARNDRDRRGLSFGAGDAQSSGAFTGASQLPALIETDWADVPEVMLNPKHLSDARIVTLAERTAEGAAFDRLRSQIHRICDRKNLQTVALTAPTRGCGTTTFALNLAFSFAQRTQSNVMLIDLHHDAPVIAARLGLFDKRASKDRPPPEVNEADEMHRIGERLLVSTPQRSPKEAPSIQRFVDTLRFVDHVRAKYRPEIVLLDLGPVLECETSLAVLEQCDAALLIASAEQTTADELDDCARRISEITNYLGAALNKSAERAARRSLRELA